MDSKNKTERTQRESTPLVQGAGCSFCIAARVFTFLRACPYAGVSPYFLAA